MTSKINKNLDVLKLSDVYSLMLFILYKIKDIPEYAVLSELCYLLDGRGITRLLTYFQGKTIKIPSEHEFLVLTNALLLYQYVNINGNSFAYGVEKLGKDITPKQKEEITDLYLKIVPIVSQYNVDRSEFREIDE